MLYLEVKTYDLPYLIRSRYMNPPVSRNIVFNELYVDFDEEVTIVEGEVRVGGQEHFYLETNASVVSVGERGQGQVHVLSSTQNLMKTQKQVFTNR